MVAEAWSHRPGWTFTVDQLWQQTRDCPAVEGRSALYAAAREAVDAGYFVPVSAIGKEGAWTVVYALNRAAAPPDDGCGFVHVPWETSRDRGLSYRARGVLIDRLAHGRTRGGVTQASHRGGVRAMAGLSPKEGREATETAVKELIEAGYARRDRVRDSATGRIGWVFVFCSERDNSGAATPPSTCSDRESSQVAPTTGFPGPGPQDRVSDTTRGALQGSPERGVGSGVRPVRAVQEGDARARVRPPQAAASESGSSRRNASPGASVASSDSQAPCAKGIQPSASDGRAAASTGPSQQARRLLAEFREAPEDERAAAAQGLVASRPNHASVRAATARTKTLTRRMRALGMVPSDLTDADLDQAAARVADRLTTARCVLASLPGEYRRTLPGAEWTRRNITAAIARLLGLHPQVGPAVVVAVAHSNTVMRPPAPPRPLASHGRAEVRAMAVAHQRQVVDALNAVWRAARTGLMSGSLCDQCGADRVDDCGPCPQCEFQVLDVIDLAEIDESDADQSTPSDNLDNEATVDAEDQDEVVDSPVRSGELDRHARARALARALVTARRA